MCSMFQCTFTPDPFIFHTINDIHGLHDILVNLLDMTTGILDDQ